MECKKCKKECMENELTNGFCSDCIKKYGEKNVNNPTQTIKITNKIAEKFKKITYATWIVGIFFALLISIATYNTIDNIFTSFVIFIVIFSLFYFSTLIFEGFSEIISLLEQIKNK